MAAVICLGHARRPRPPDRPIDAHNAGEASAGGSSDPTDQAAGRRRAEGARPRVRRDARADGAALDAAGATAEGAAVDRVLLDPIGTTPRTVKDSERFSGISETARQSEGSRTGGECCGMSS